MAVGQADRSDGGTVKAKSRAFKINHIGTFKDGVLLKPGDKLRIVDDFKAKLTPHQKKVAAARKLIADEDAKFFKVIKKVSYAYSSRPDKILLHPDTYVKFKEALASPPALKPTLHWLQRCQALIQKHESVPVRKSGKYKGHSSTDSAAWIKELTDEVQKDIKRCQKGIAYDENMALAVHVGRILSVWYFCVHRAKAYDPNRPIHNRQIASKKRGEYFTQLIAECTSDELMTQAFPDQWWNLPYGKNQINGSFV